MTTIEKAAKAAKTKTPKAAKAPKAPKAASKFKQKQDVISDLAHRTTLTRDAITRVLSAYSDLIAEELVNSGGINLPDLGRAKAHVRKPVEARNSVNPRTREPMVIPAVPSKTTYKAKFGKDFLGKVAVLTAAKTA